MEFYVLSQGTWPLKTQQNIVQVPKEIQSVYDSFDKFYQKKFQGRTLKWSIEHGTCLIKGNFEQGKVSCQFEASAI